MASEIAPTVRAPLSKPIAVTAGCPSATSSSWCSSNSNAKYGVHIHITPTSPNSRVKFVSEHDGGVSVLLPISDNRHEVTRIATASRVMPFREPGGYAAPKTRLKIVSTWAV